MADAQEFVSSERTYDERLRGARVAALGDDLFGDSLNRKDGTLQFSQTDVVVPTSSGMRVAFTRTTPKQKQGLDRAAAPLGASWEIDAPYMMGSYDQRRGWNAAGGGRCSGSNLSPTEWVGPSPDFNTRVIPKHTYWSGIFINLPAVGYESLLLKEAGASLPQDGATYIGTSASQWRVSCLPAIRNGTGEGFVVRTTDGTRYFFDWMAVRDQHDVLANEYYRDGNGNGTSQPYLLVPVVDVFLYATRVEDRHGNWVSYSYDGANPTRLLAIISNDGARIDIDYDAQGKIGAVRAGDRTWRYNYVDSYWGAHAQRSRTSRPVALDLLHRPPCGRHAVDDGAPRPESRLLHEFLRAECNGIPLGRCRRPGLQRCDHHAPSQRRTRGVLASPVDPRIGQHAWQLRHHRH
ncbi:hypothetical protein [Stenotrophomonas maltophilia]|uniref:hypothetical protein n=1 Tax=Stenotrophomonas maltophilia TaxID=40324 RepID=UPI001E442C77|nr:hypothetical protein [Stenotrophomonas maltophilia]